MNMKQKEPMVSVVTPVYNGDRYLEECIQSVLSQTYQNWEYVILNNCSTDRTQEIAESYAKRDKRIHINNNNELLPIMKNWNRALRHISPESKYCKVVHADDFLFPECLEQMVSLAEAYPTTGIVASYSLWGNRVVSDGLPYSTEFLPGRELCRLTLLDEVYCFWSPSSLLILSDLIRKREFFYNEVYLHADVEACYEILQESDFGFVHQVLTYIRKHEESMTSLVAAPNNRIILSNLDLLARYGPIYLSPDEHKKHFKTKLGSYYYFLARNLFNLRERDFWKFHINGMKRTSFKFRFSKLFYALIRLFIKNPVKNIYMMISALAEKLKRSKSSQI